MVAVITLLLFLFFVVFLMNIAIHSNCRIVYRTSSVCSPLLAQCTTSQSVSAIIGWDNFVQVPFALTLDPDYLYDIRASVHRGIPFCIIFQNNLLKHLITQILCQGSINYLLRVNTKKSKNKQLYL